MATCYSLCFGCFQHQSPNFLRIHILVFLFFIKPCCCLQQNKSICCRLYRLVLLKCFQSYLAESSELYITSNVGFGLDSKQITDLRKSVLTRQNEDLHVAILKLLIIAARYQAGKDASVPDWACRLIAYYSTIR